MTHQNKKHITVNSKELRVIFHIEKNALLVSLSEQERQIIFDFIKEKYLNKITTIDITSKELIYVEDRDDYKKTREILKPYFDKEIEDE